MIQETWVSLCLMPVLAINALPASTFAALDTVVSITGLTGLLLYVGGLSFEVTTDWQKSTWVQEEKGRIHEDDFLTRGPWSKSRHPNYFGESMLWTGIATLTAGLLASGAGAAGMGLSAGWQVRPPRYWQLALALRLCSSKSLGAPLSENKYDKKYGDREGYKKWKRETLWSGNFGRYLMVEGRISV
jgi:protein-S-isoprenylcysteine O-methyltransferase Ste14